VIPSRRLLPLAAVLAAACTRPRPAAPAQEAHDSVVADGLLLRGTTRVWGAGAESVRVAVRLTNRRAARARFVYGACALDPRLLPAAGPARRPAYVWSERPESSLVRHPDGAVRPVFWGCPAYAVVADIAPGDSLAPNEFTWQEGLDSVRADSLRGAYRVVGRLKLSGRTYDVPAGTVRLR
jgi:hypothetical protein